MIAEIISIGTELLLGDTLNTNAYFLAKELALLGITSYYQTVVGDNPGRLLRVLEHAFTQADMVVITGGLGPTYDDLTKETVANYFGLLLEEDKESRRMIEERFAHLKDTMSPNNYKQALMPKGAIVFSNYCGTANGVAIEKDGKIAILLPGPPKEMMMMFETGVRPYLEEKTNQVFVSHNIHFFGIGESALEEQMHDWMVSSQNPTIAPYAKEGEVLLRVTARAHDKETAEQLLKPVVEEICKNYAEYIYSVNIPSLEEAVVCELQRLQKRIATAESCTGGLVSERITRVPGSSEVFELGMCTYANRMKELLVGVSPITLEKHGAVSAETALEMARGIREAADADIGISTTGIAGPGGETDEKPIGLVYIALSHADGEEVKELRLGSGDINQRAHIRLYTSSHILFMVLKWLQKLR